MPRSPRNLHPSPTGDDHNDRLRALHPANRSGTLRAPRHGRYLRHLTLEIIEHVISLAESLAIAEEEQEEKRRQVYPDKPPCYVPAFGEPFFGVPPEHITLRDYINTLEEEKRCELLATTHYGQEPAHHSASTFAYLVENARSNTKHAGDYLASKSNLATYLRDGLRKLESGDTDRMPRNRLG